MKSNRWFYRVAGLEKWSPEPVFLARLFSASRSAGRDGL